VRLCDVLPPGETYDPAYYGLDALAILRGEMPIYFETNYGREPLFSYLVAACVALLGVGSTAIHVASAVVGIITVPAVYLAAEELFATDDGLLGKWGGLTAALATALSFWHVSWSRYGVRAILTPLFAALAVSLLWRGLRVKRWWLFAGCGMLLGLGMYTYQASYLLPMLAVTGFVFATWRTRSWNKTVFFQMAAVTLVALLVFAPLGVYYLRHTDSSLERVEQVNVLQETDVLSTFKQTLVKTILVFGIQGDTMPTTNLPGRPALDPFFFAAFVVGIAISLWRIKEPAFFLLLAWLGMMCLPGVLAQHAETVKRIIGSLPAVMILVAVGLLVPLEWIWQWATERDQRKWVRGTVTAVASVTLAAGFAYSGAQTYQDYFDTWGQDPALFTHFEAGLVAIGQTIANLPDEERVYVSPVYVGHPSIRYNSRERSDVKGYHGDYCLVLPYQAEHGTTYIIVPGEDRRSVSRLQTYLPQGTLIADGPLHYQQPYFVSYHVPAGAQARTELTHELVANWANQIQLLGYDAAYDEDSNRISIQLSYRALRTMDTDYTAFVQLIGPYNPKTGGPLWSQSDSEPCKRYRPTSTWSTDEMLIDDFALTVPVDLVSGEAYELIMGFYDWKTLERLMVVDETGQPVSDYLVLEQHVFRP
jgi:4-amino-4-deoxy-L-arabinose transferase-like glycosyltransferase